MNEKIKSAINVLADEIKAGIEGNDALKLTQAVANLANALCSLKSYQAEED